MSRVLARHAAAFVAGRPITTGDVDRRMARIRTTVGPERLPAPGSPEDGRLRRWIVHALVNEALVAAEAARRGLSQDPATEPDDAVVVAVFDALTNEVGVDEAAVARFYADNIDRYRRGPRWLVRRLVVPDRATARAALERARAGGDLTAPGRRAEQVTLVPGRPPDTFERLVCATPAGGWVGPVAVEHGWCVAQVKAAAPAHVEPLHAVASQIAAELLAGARGRRFDEWLVQRRAACVTIAPGQEHPGDPRVPDSIHRH